VLNEVDGAVGLEVPIFLFGFAKMTRGISCRSDLRVPTHMILSLGIGHSIDKMIQAMGRGTFIGKSTLLQNRPEDPSVKILTTVCDYETMIAHQRFVLHIQKLTESGVTFADALSKAKTKIPKEFDFKSLSPRKIGQRKKDDNDERFEEMFPFEERAQSDELTEAQNATRLKFSEDVRVNRTMRVLLELDAKGAKVANPIENIMEAYNDTFKGFPISEEYNRITKTALTKALNDMLKAGAPIRKKSDAGVGKKRGKKCVQRITHWYVENWTLLDKVMNDSLAYQDTSRDDDFVPEDESS